MLRQTICLPLVVLIASCLGLAGCGGGGSGAAPAASVPGVYDLDVEAMKAALQAQIDDPATPAEDKMGMQMGLGMMDGMSMTVTLDADGTAAMEMEMSFMGQTQTDSDTGTWTFEGGTITISSEDPESGDVETVSGTIEGDVMRLVMEEEADGPDEMIFKKRG